MGKLKTKQAARKRFTFSAKGKARRRHNHQAHFNARQTGNQMRSKHRTQPVSVADEHRLTHLLPYG